MEDRDPQCHEWARYTEVGVAVELCQEEGNHNSALASLISKFLSDEHSS